MTNGTIAVLRLTRAQLDRITEHLLPEPMEQEEAAFCFADVAAPGGASAFALREWFGVPPEGFRSRSAYHLDLTDETRVGAIMRAHELGSCLIEWHSHCGPWLARFSPSDQLGFEEFVPHVRWRLGGRPYAAVVLAKGSFDGLAWIDDGPPRRLSIMIEGHEEGLKPTGLSSLGEEERYERPI